MCKDVPGNFSHPCMCVPHLPPRGGVYFLSLSVYLGWPCDTLFPVECGRCNNMTSLMRSSSLHFHSLGVSLPFCKEAQPILLCIWSMWRGRPWRGQLRLLSQWPAPQPQWCEWGHLGSSSPVGSPQLIPYGAQMNSVSWDLLKFMTHRIMSNDHCFKLLSFGVGSNR